jgi:hypothetical protein
VTSGKDLDRRALHAFLGSKAGRGGKLTLHQQELAAEFGMAPTHLSRVVQEFVRDGKMKLLSSGYRNVKTYLVKPWSAEEQPPPPGASL